MYLGDVFSFLFFMMFCAYLGTKEQFIKRKALVGVGCVFFEIYRRHNVGERT